MKILIAAGGTGGHLYPGLAVARALSGHEVRFVVRRGDLGRLILQKDGFPVQEISGQGLPRALTLKAVCFPFNLLRGSVEALSLLRAYRPNWVLGMGGYLSVPIILAARLLGIRTLLHEQNVLPGLANRLLSRWVNSTAVSFSASKASLKGKSVWVSGLPIRADIGCVDQDAGRQTLGLDPSKPMILVFGGSLGAQRLNSLVLEVWPLLMKERLPFQVLHVTGTKDFDRVEALYRRLRVTASVQPYCHAMASAYAAADAVVCRAGASTIAELLAVKRPAFLVPYPYASNNHQLYNARIIETYGLGQMALDRDATPSGIAEFVKTVLQDANFKRRFDSAVQSLPTDVNSHDTAARLADFLRNNP